MKTLVLALAAALCACGGSVDAHDTGIEVTVDVRLADGEAPLTGTLLVGWYRRSELSTVGPSGRPRPTMLATLIERLHARHVQLDRSIEVNLGVRPEAAEVVALVVGEGQLWPALLGAPAPVGRSPVITSWPGPGGTATVTLKRPPPPSSEPRARPVPCSGKRFQRLTIAAPEVAGSIGNPTQRHVCVYLPPSYAASPSARYPTVYLLPGLMSTDTAYLRAGGGLARAADALAADGSEVILVGVDTSAAMGSTYLVDSPIAGRWERFLVDRVVPAVDSRFRTVASGRMRGLVGQSTGGFNAMSYGLRYPDVFSAVGASAPDGLDLESWLLEGDTVRPLWLAWARVEALVGGGGQMLSYGAAWSPPFDGRPGFRFPFDLATGAVDAEAIGEWLRHSPRNIASEPERLKRVKQHLQDRILITVPEGDEFDLHAPALAFSKHLRALGVSHTFESPDGGHFDGAGVRLARALAFVLGHLK